MPKVPQNETIESLKETLVLLYKEYENQPANIIPNFVKQNFRIFLNTSFGSNTIRVGANYNPVLNAQLPPLIENSQPKRLWQPSGVKKKLNTEDVIVDNSTLVPDDIHPENEQSIQENESTEDNDIDSIRKRIVELGGSYNKQNNLEMLKKILAACEAKKNQK